MVSHEDCRYLMGSLSEFVDGSLEIDVCAEIDRHLAECDDCRIVVDSLQKTIYLYHASAEQDSIPEGVKDRLFRSLELDDLLPK